MKKIIITILMLLMLIGLAGLVNSATTVTLDSLGVLTNNSYDTDGTIPYNILVTGNLSTWTCDLWTNENGSNGVGSWHLEISNLVVANNTNTSFTSGTNVKQVTGPRYTWDAFCNGTSEGTGDWGAGGQTTGYNLSSMNYSVDTTNPSVTVNYPTANKVWYNSYDGNTSVRVGLTVEDYNADSCILQGNFNLTNNVSKVGAYRDIQIATYSNGTQFNFTDVNNTFAFPPNSTGGHLYSYKCNDSAGRWTNLSTNYTFFMDILPPSAFIFSEGNCFRTDNRFILNATTSTDYTPQVCWAPTTEANFSRYEVYFYQGNYGNETYLNVNTSSRTANVTNITSLSGDKDYWILVTAIDLAGNKRNMTSIYKYSTDSTNRALSAGWNIIGNVGNSFNLSDIRNWTAATTASVWQANHTFRSHVAGGSYGDTNVAAGDSVLLYVASSTTLSDLVWNTTAVSEEDHEIVNYTDSGSQSAWNLVMMRDDDDNKTFQNIDSYVNCYNGTVWGAGCTPSANNATYSDYFSAYNNSASAGAKYIPYVANWSINNGSLLEYGNVLWMYASRLNATINWTGV